MVLKGANVKAQYFNSTIWKCLLYCLQTLSQSDVIGVGPIILKILVSAFLPMLVVVYW